MVSWWRSEPWLAYERAVGDGYARERLLASADWQTRVLDLRPDEPVLWSGVRKSYRPLINRLRDDSGFGVLSGYSRDLMSTCRRLHTEQAGRETRSRESWEVQAQWLEAGLGICLLGFRITEGEPSVADVVGFAYIVRSGRWAYYFSAASKEPNVQHALQWAAIKRLKAFGVHYYELGWQGQAEDEKGKQIEFFRRGFGGVDVHANWDGENL
jgi:hypothetical protein